MMINIFESKNISLRKLSKKSEEPLKNILYGDTDSIFISSFDLLVKEYAKVKNLSENDARVILTEYFNMDVEGVKIDKDEIDLILSLSKKIADKYVEKIQKDIKYLENSFNIDYKTTIQFDFEYLASAIFISARKNYVAKEFGNNMFIQKSLGAKRSDPKLTKDFLREMNIKILIKQNPRDLFIFLIKNALHFKNAIEEFKYEVGIPFTLNKDFSEYKTVTNDLKAVLNWVVVVNLLVSSGKLTKNQKSIFKTFSPGDRGFKFKIIDVKTSSKYKIDKSKINSIKSKIAGAFYEKYNLKVDPQNHITLKEIAIPIEVLENDQTRKILKEIIKPDVKSTLKNTFTNYLNRYFKKPISPYFIDKILRIKDITTIEKLRSDKDLYQIFFD